MAVETDLDRAYVFVSAPPRWSLAQIAKVLSQRAQGLHVTLSARTIPRSEAHLRTGSIGTRAYYVGAAGPVSADIVRHYIADCHGR